MTRTHPSPWRAAIAPLRALVLLALPALLVLAPRLGAQAGTSAATVLELPSSARAMGLGGAYAALASDEAALFYNPAGLGALDHASAGLSVQRHLASSTLGALAAALPVGPGAFAIGVQVLDYGSVQEVVPDPAYGGERGVATGGRVGAQDFVASAGYGFAGAHVRAGLALKLVRQGVADVSASTAAADIGLAADAPLGATVALAVQNIGGDMLLAGGKAPLPRLVRVGAALPLPAMGAVGLLATAELSQGREGGPMPAGGVEATWRAVNGVRVAMRAGVAQKPADAASSMLAFGAGLAARHVSLDYAYQGYDVVGGGVHRLGVRWQR